MSSSLFSSDAENVIHRTLSAPQPAEGGKNPEGSLEEIYEIYEIQKTVRFIQENAARKVALQFPDDLLADSVVIAGKLEDVTGARMYVLADTSYGSCCVDEVAAEHVAADCLIHYGGSCLSPSNRLPVLYVFRRKPVDVTLCAGNFRNVFTERQAPAVIFSDVRYQHVLDELLALLVRTHPRVLIAELSRVGHNSLLDSGEFYRPVVTPEEMEVACNPAREWGGYCVTEFRELLPGGSSHVPFPDIDPEDADRTDVSLITGDLRSMRFSAETCEESVGTALAQRNAETTMAERGTAASFLSSRSWQGLDKSLGQSPVVKALEGRRGIAIAYEDEAPS
ncbi:2-(3-amino-3-carboxypropyl)histidine synthase subunit 2 [Mantella aurantiaca]